MSVLSDSSIISMIESGSLLTGDVDRKGITPNGYDLRIAITRLEGGKDCEDILIPPKTGFLVSSLERIELPPHISASIWIRSSYARRGVIGSFGYVDAGFHGNLTLSFYNSSNNPIQIKKGDRIAQIVFTLMDQSVDKTYDKRSGNYQNSSGIKI